MAMEITSSDFAADSAIPKQYTCQGLNGSPALSWKGAPNGTASFALVCDDPDAPMGTWVHWVVYNMPAQVAGLPGNVRHDEKLADGTCQGVNDFQTIGYGGPCPPPGKAHRYYFKLYALDAMLVLTGRITKDTLETAMQGHILAQAELMGTFKR